MLPTTNFLVVRPWKQKRDYLEGEQKCVCVWGGVGEEADRSDICDLDVWDYDEAHIAF